MLLAALLLQAKPVPTSPCDNAGGDVEIAQCWTGAYDRADAELNRRWPDVLKAASEADRAFVPNQRRGAPAAVQDLKNAQRAWLKYRDAQCELESDYAQGGSLQAIIASRCETELTLARIKQLQDIAAGFRDG
ncbi:lysozyme inhibitor LprI family protein [Sphingomonas beigongshangi]|uniref:lysozyme inhibitor LprI family protein n=1 Tax=Sphingomonas beigongshangi TaxID=2782540 RepID=UPI00193B4100|nr:lysozyme inhibitor LprI family protein [Sphingomonas beigongshangi]